MNDLRPVDGMLRTAPRDLRAAPVGDGVETRRPIITRYLGITLRWKWLILGCIVSALLIGFLITMLMTPLYTAGTRLEINRVGARIVQVTAVEPETSSVDQEFYQTQYGILESRALAERVARDLRLADNAQFLELMDQEEMAQELAPGSRANAAGARDRRMRRVVDILLENVDVVPIRLSKLVDIRWTSPDPQFSARIANAWAEGFIQHNLARRYEATAYARQFLEQRLTQLRQRLEESERQLVGYASSQALINIPIGNGGEGQPSQERSITADSLVALNNALAEAQVERVRAESRMQRSARGATAEALANPTLTALRSRRAEAAAEYARLMTQFEPGYPVAEALQSQIRQIEASISQEEGRIQSSMQGAYQESVQRERAINQRVEDLKQSVLDQRRRGIQYNIFQRDVDTNRELYDGLLQRYKEIGVAGGVGENNVLIVDRALVPTNPSSPRPLLNLLLALVVGTVLGGGLALLMSQMDETLNDPSEVENRIGLPMLGAIPRSASTDPLVELRDPKSHLVEACLSMLTNLSFTTDHGLPRTLTVTSTKPGEGKSTTAHALAYVIARQGGRTLIIDSDMRSPSLHHHLGISNKQGLSNYLAGGESLDNLIVKPTDEPFWAMPAGPQPPNAAELLRTNRLEQMLSDLAGRFDHIVIDSPPVMGLADAPIIAANVEGTIYVIEAHSTKARLAKVAINRLLQGRGRVLGCVLTKFEPKRIQYGYGEGYGYGYGYGYGQDETKKA